MMDAHLSAMTDASPEGLNGVPMSIPQVGQIVSISNYLQTMRVEEVDEKLQQVVLVSNAARR
jgi:hypothetical protein